MKFRFAWLGIVLPMLACVVLRGQVQPLQPAAAPVAAPQPPSLHDPDAARCMAERFCEIALELAQKAEYSPSSLRQSAALLDAAVKLNPYEPRFLRLLAFWHVRTGDDKAATAAWTKYLGATVAPGDLVAECEMIDLYLAEMQSNDGKIKYIRQVLGNPKLDPTVKAHLAAECAMLLDQRSRPEALEMLAQARKFYPLPEVTRLEWEMLPADATPVAQLTALLNIVRANPANPTAVGDVANLLSANGLSDKALLWYGIFVDINAINDTPTDESFMLNYLAERFRESQTPVANDQLDRILQRYPDDPHAWFLRLTTQKSQESQQMLNEARGVFAQRVADLCDRIKKAPVGGELAAPRPKAPATAPAAAAPADPAPPLAAPAVGPADLAQAATLVKKLDPKVESVLAETLADQAWFEIYYDHNAPAAVPAIDALKKLVPADNVGLKRLQGWQAFVSGDETAARAFLNPQKDQDPLSALGLFEIESKKGNAAAAAALGSKLLSFPQTGELAAVIFQAVRAHGVKGAPATANTPAMKAEIDKFPAELLDVIHTPAKFYTVSTAITPATVLGNPMLADITLTNVGKFDITIGPEGLIKQVYTINAQLQGVVPMEMYPGVLSDRIMGKLVLRPNESITQTERIDQGDLSRALQKLPAVPLFVQAAVVVNASASNPGGRAHAGGTYMPFDRKFARTSNSLALAAARERKFADLATGSGKDKIPDLDLISVYYIRYVNKNSTDAELAAAGDFLSALDRCSHTDPDFSVRAWAQYRYALISNGVEPTKEIAEMIQTRSMESQLLGLVAMQKVLPPGTALQWAKAATGANDALVKSYAEGVVQMLEQQIATQAAAQARPPATQPAAPK